MKKHLIFIFTTLVLCTSGCTDYLNLKSDATWLVPQTLDDLQSILDDSSVMNQRSAPALAISVADEFYLPLSYYLARPEELQELYTWQKYEYRGIGNDWARCYQAIYNSNLVLDLLADIDRNDSNGPQYDNVLGSAYFFRAFYFLGLISQYGHAFDEKTADTDLGIVLRLTSDFNVPSTRATVRECYEKVVSDLRKSIDLLPIYSEHLMRPSRGAAFALLARAYLYMGKYDLSLIEAERALAINDRLMDFNGDDGIIGIKNTIPFQKYNKETVFYAEAAGSPSYLMNRGIVDSLLYDSFHDHDLRKVAFFNVTGGEPYFKGTYASSSSVLFGGITTSEIYLMVAECKAVLGDVKDAMDTLNKLLISRWDNTTDFLPYITNNQELAIKIVRDERKKELCFRNLRWADIKRYNKEGANIVLQRNIGGAIYRLLPNDPFYALPLPSDIIELTGMPQN